MTGSSLTRASLAALAAIALASPAPSRAPQPTQQLSLAERLTPIDLEQAGRQGMTIEHDRGARGELADHRRLATALATLRPEHKGVVEAFVLAVALDSDAVFGREAREAGRVLARRYNAAGHEIVLAGPDGEAESALARGSVANVEIALARIAETMGPEDVLVLYTTSHGAPYGIVYSDSGGDQGSGFGVIGPSKLADLLNELGIRNRMLLISACFSGVFVGPTITPDTAIMTAASSQKTSFGCKADNDWTFFGDALINHALRTGQPFEPAAQDARRTIAAWEAGARLVASEPQLYVGQRARGWLAILERTLPPATAPVGKPATDALRDKRR